MHIAHIISRQLSQYVYTVHNTFLFLVVLSKHFVYLAKIMTHIFSYFDISSAITYINFVLFGK